MVNGVILTNKLDDIASSKRPELTRTEQGEDDERTVPPGIMRDQFASDLHSEECWVVKCLLEEV